jgi:hypothetical protein
MNDFDIRRIGPNGPIQRGPAPPEPSRRWQKILANVGMFIGAGLAVVWMIATNFDGIARLVVLVGVLIGGGLGWVLGFCIDTAVNTAAAPPYEDTAPAPVNPPVDRLGDVGERFGDRLRRSDPAQPPRQEDRWADRPDDRGDYQRPR